MTPEDQIQRQIQRAGEARQILDSRLFQEARADIESTLASLRRSVSITSTDAHTRIILMDQLWGRLVDYFEQIAQTGKLASLQVEQEQRKRSLMEQGLAIFRTSGRNAL